MLYEVITYPNVTMGMRFKAHMEALGEEVKVASPTGRYGSSDIGDVSLIMPRNNFV